MSVIKKNLHMLSSMASSNDYFIHKHASMLIYNGKVVECVNNQLSGKYIYHAEMNVVMSFLKKRGKRQCLLQE